MSLGSVIKKNGEQRAGQQRRATTRVGGHRDTTDTSSKISFLSSNRPTLSWVFLFSPPIHRFTIRSHTPPQVDPDWHRFAPLSTYPLQIWTQPQPSWISVFLFVLVSLGRPTSRSVLPPYHQSTWDLNSTTAILDQHFPLRSCTSRSTHTEIDLLPCYPIHFRFKLSYGHPGSALSLSLVT